MADTTGLFDNDWRAFPTVSRDQWLMAFEKGKLPGHESLTRQFQGIDFSAINTYEHLPPVDRTATSPLSFTSCILEEQVVAPSPQALEAQIQSGISGLRGTGRQLASVMDYLNQHPGSLRSVSLVAEQGSDNVLRLFLDQVRQRSQNTPLQGTIYLPSTTWEYWQKHAGSSSIERIVELFTAAAKVPSIRVLPIPGDAFHALGATVISELAMVLSWFVTYCDLLTEAEVSVSSVFARTEITLATGADYFIDLAKFRALRVLIGKVAKAYGLEEQPEAIRIAVRAVSGTINKTYYDPDSNLLRNTTEALAALLGGVNTLSLLPHDDLYPTAGTFGKRMATQVYNILRHEGQVERVYDPAAGSYFLEDITGQLVEKSWERFLQLEEAGGFLTSLQDGSLMARCQQEASERTQRVRTQRSVLVGATRYVNPEEEIVFGHDATSLDTFFAGHGTPRWAASFERLRSALDEQVAHGQPRPTLQLWVQQDTASAAQINQRVHYVKDLLASTGMAYQVVALTKVQDIIHATFTERHQVGFVACGTDDFYVTTLLDMLQKGNFSVPCRWIAGGTAAVETTVRQAGGNGVLGMGRDVIALIEQTINHRQYEA